MKEKNKKKEVKTSKFNNMFHGLSDNTSKLTKIDFKILLFFIVVYAIMAFSTLGTTKNPETYYKFNYNGEEVGLELNSIQHVSKIRYYTGAETGSFIVMISEDGNEYHNVTDFRTNSVFAWEEQAIDADLKYVKFVAEDVGSYLGDVVLYDTYGNKITATTTDDQSAVINDEVNTVPIQINYKNSSYFDEIYFARSAYEYVHGIDAMEWTHPPLGKLLMTIPIILFGFSPFTYRFMGALAGLLMIPVIYA